jgi:hypothetical protein
MDVRVFKFSLYDELSKEFSEERAKELSDILLKYSDAEVEGMLLHVLDSNPIMDDTFFKNVSESSIIIDKSNSKRIFSKEEILNIIKGNNNHNIDLDSDLFKHLVKEHFKTQTEDIAMLNLKKFKELDKRIHKIVDIIKEKLK